MMMMMMMIMIIIIIIIIIMRGISDKFSEHGYRTFSLSGSLLLPQDFHYLQLMTVVTTR